jgi:hypothetical protein
MKKPKNQQCMRFWNLGFSKNPIRKKPKNQIRANPGLHIQQASTDHQDRHDADKGRILNRGHRRESRIERHWTGISPKTSIFEWRTGRAVSDSFFGGFAERAAIDLHIDSRALRYNNELIACISVNPLDEEPTLPGDDHLGQPGTTSDVSAEAKWPSLLAMDAYFT